MSFEIQTRRLASWAVAFLAIAFSALPPARADEPPSRSYDIVWGGFDNIEAGATTTESATSLVFDQVSIALHASRFDRVATRALNVVILQLYLGALVYGSFAHEFFGHYSLALQAGVHPTLSLAFPAFGGTTQFRTTYETPALTRQEIAAAGPEVTETIAYQSTQAMYSGHPVASYTGLELVGGHVVDSYLYYRSSLQPFLRNPAQYLAANDRNPLAPVPNDPIAWALALTERYGFYRGVIPANAIWVYVPSNPNVYLNAFILDQGERVRRAFMLQLFDPTMLNGLYGLARYLVTGDPFFRPFMIGTSAFGVAPSIRADLGYLGAETYFDLFFISDRLPPFSVYYRTGGNLYDALTGAGAEIREIRLTSRIELAGQADGWYDGLARKLGGNLQERVVVCIWPHLGLVEAFGYKSVGSLMGKPTAAGPYGELGVRITLPR